jgi:hypothetical protein
MIIGANRAAIISEVGVVDGVTAPVIVMPYELERGS